MARKRYGLEAELHEAGFSTRAIHALIYSVGIESLDELRRLPWGDRRDHQSLCGRLGVSPNVGKKCLAEVEAFRAGKDPRSARAPGPFYVSAPLDEAQLAALDAWIAAQPKPVSRPEAIRAMVAAALEIMAEPQKD
jgi:hypothetical protein